MVCKTHDICFSSRQKRGDDADCPQCSAQVTAPIVLEQLKINPLCSDRSIMVCKDCVGSIIYNLTHHSYIDAFEAFCFDTANFINKVSTESNPVSKV